MDLLLGMSAKKTKVTDRNQGLFGQIGEICFIADFRQIPRGAKCNYVFDFQNDRAWVWQTEWYQNLDMCTPICGNISQNVSVNSLLCQLVHWHILEEDILYRS